MLRAGVTICTFQSRNGGLIQARNKFMIPAFWKDHSSSHVEHKLKEQEGRQGALLGGQKDMLVVCRRSWYWEGREGNGFKRLI